MYENVEERINLIRLCLNDMLMIEKKLSELSLPESIDEFNKLMDEMVYKSEKMTDTVRKLAADTFVTENDNIMRQAAEIHGITVEKKGEILEVNLPFILPKKKNKNCKFIANPLYYAINNALHNDDFRIRERAVICFVYIYSGTNLYLMPRDYDNIETKNIMDVIALFTLDDDGAEFCDIFHTMERGEKDKTKILVMPERCFWNMKKDRRDG